MNASSPSLHLRQGGQVEDTGWNSNNNSTAPPFVFYRFNASLTIIIAVLVMAFFFMGMVALYVWRCSSEDDLEAALQAAGVIRRPPVKRVQGIDKAGMEQLPVVCYQGSSKEQAECAVCLTNFEEGDKIRLLPKCSHSFHSKCIDVWLSAHASCPICRCNLINFSSSASSSQQSQAQQQIISSSQPEVHIPIENVTS